MNHQHEDNPPMTPPREYRDVVDFANALCMQARANKQREAQAKALRLASRYHVDYGYQGANTQHFVLFDRALEFYLDHLDDGPGPHAPKLRGYAYDDTSDGLTDDEQAAVEAADEMVEEP